MVITNLITPIILTDLDWRQNEVIAFEDDLTNIVNNFKIKTIYNNFQKKKLDDKQHNINIYQSR